MRRAPASAAAAGALALLAGLACSVSPRPAVAAEFDIPWFEAHLAQRRAWLRACGDDQRVARDPRCANAERAESRAYAQRLARRGGGGRGGALPPGFDTPLARDALGIACARPLVRDGLLERRCGRRT